MYPEPIRSVRFDFRMIYSAAFHAVGYQKTLLVVRFNFTHRFAVFELLFFFVVTAYAPEAFFPIGKMRVTSRTNFYFDFFFIA